MNMSSKINDDFENLRKKIKLLKGMIEIYRTSVKSSNYSKHEKVKKSFNLYGENQFVSRKEFLVVDKCFKTSLKLIELHNKNKQDCRIDKTVNANLSVIDINNTSKKMQHISKRKIKHVSKNVSYHKKKISNKCNKYSTKHDAEHYYDVDLCSDSEYLVDNNNIKEERKIKHVSKNVSYHKKKISNKCNKYPTKRDAEHYYDVDLCSDSEYLVDNNDLENGNYYKFTNQVNEKYLQSNCLHLQNKKAEAIISAEKSNIIEGKLKCKKNSHLQQLCTECNNPELSTEEQHPVCLNSENNKKHTITSSKSFSLNKRGKQDNLNGKYSAHINSTELNNNKCDNDVQPDVIYIETVQSSFANEIGKNKRTKSNIFVKKRNSENFGGVSKNTPLEKNNSLLYSDSTGTTEILRSANERDRNMIMEKEIDTIIEKSRDDDVIIENTAEDDEDVMVEQSYLVNKIQEQCLKPNHISERRNLNNYNVMSKDYSQLKDNCLFYSDISGSMRELDSTNLGDDVIIENEPVVIAEENFDMIIEDEQEFFPNWDFTEEPVDFIVPRIHLAKTTKLSKKELNSLESEGIRIRKGRWTSAETAILKRNFEDFTTKFGVKDVNLLLGIGRRTSINKAEFGNVKKFLRAKHFLVRLGKGLDNRFLKYIYSYARRILNPFQSNHASEELSTITQLCNLHKRYGNQWELISRKIKIPSDTCVKLFQKYGKPRNKGTWTVDEKNNLLHAIRTVTGICDLSLICISPIPFTEVAKLVPTRNAYQCRMEWIFNQSRKFSTAICQEWNKNQAAKLVYILNNVYPVDNELDIKWAQVFKHFKRVFPICYMLRYKWSSMKESVPQNHKINFPSLLKYLCKRYENELKDIKL